MGDYLYSTFSPSCNRLGVRFADMTGDGRQVLIDASILNRTDEVQR